MHQRFARGRQRHALTGSIQQFETQLLLEILDPVAGGRRRQMRTLRRAREVLRVGDMKEQTQIHEIEMHDENQR